jgi:hypothetical protein
MIQIKRLKRRFKEKFDEWIRDRTEVIASLPDNPWTYPCCGIHVKTSDFFCGENHLTIPEPKKIFSD